MSALVITGASGQLGRRTAELALAELAQVGRSARDLILVTRHPEQLATLAERGAQVRHGDFDQAASLQAAFKGATRLLLISAVELSRRVEQHRAALAAAKAVGVGHVIYTSMLRPEAGNPAAVAPSHLQTETDLIHSGLSYSFLRNSLYGDYQLPEAKLASERGSFRHNRGTGRIAYVAREDCAAAAAALLVRGGAEYARYDITGPESLDANALAHLYSSLSASAPSGVANRIAAKPGVQPIAISDAEYISDLMSGKEDDGHARYGAQLLASFGQAIREGHLDGSSGDVERLTGRPATPLARLLAPLLRTS